MGSELRTRGDSSRLRYAQCWEDADILLEGLDVQPGDVCLSIASAGDNTLALLTRQPSRVIAVDISPAQLACLELRVAAYRSLTHGELLELIGSMPSRRRWSLYHRLRGRLSPATCAFWDARPHRVADGVGGAGKFERYLQLFRERILPCIHSRRTRRKLLRPRPAIERERFYDATWDTWRWRLLFRLFFSRRVMGLLGRDPSFFRYVEGSVADRILARTRHALTALDPAANPYLQWILTGHHETALPLALRPEHFENIRANLDRLEWHHASLEDFLQTHPNLRLDRCNLSDIFEYMSPAHHHGVVSALADRMRTGGRLAYWNMLVPRQRPESLAHRLRPLVDLAARLHAQDRAFFYSAFVIEEVMG